MHVGTPPVYKLYVKTLTKCMLRPPMAYKLDVKRRAKCMLIPPLAKKLCQGGINMLLYRQ